MNTYTITLTYLSGIEIMIFGIGGEQLDNLFYDIRQGTKLHFF